MKVILEIFKRGVQISWNGLRSVNWRIVIRFGTVAFHRQDTLISKTKVVLICPTKMSKSVAGRLINLPNKYLLQPQIFGIFKHDSFISICNYEDQILLLYNFLSFDAIKFRTYLILLGLIACLYSVYQIFSSPILVFNEIILGFLRMILEVMFLSLQFADF